MGGKERSGDKPAPQDIREPEDRQGLAGEPVGRKERRRERQPAPLQGGDRSEEGAGELLASVAAAALNGGGEFGPTLIENAAGSTVKGAAARALVADLTARNVLIVRREVGEQQVYRFADEAIPSYLWFLSAQKRGGDSEPQPHRSRAK